MSRTVLTSLGYSPHPPWHRRRHVHYLFALAVTLLACAAAARYVTPRVKERMGVTAVQAQCLAYVQPEDRVAYLWGAGRSTPACYASFASNFAAPDPTLPVVFMHERRSPA